MSSESDTEVREAGMEEIIESAREAARDCGLLSERLRLPAARLEAVIPYVNSQWRGAAGEEFAAGLRQIYEKIGLAEQRLVILAERIEQAANELSAEF